MEKVIHINSYYFTNSLHENLIKELEILGVTNKVYVPVSKFNSSQESKFVTQIVLPNFIYKIWFIRVILSTIKIIQLCKPTNQDLIHAHTLIFNGSIAMILNKIFGTKYIVSIRNTDVNIYFKYMFFRLLGKMILSNSSKICFISPVYIKNVNKTLGFKPNFLNIKSIILPNGIDNFYLNNLSCRISQPTRTLNLLFIGTINNNKNLKGLIDACDLIHDKYNITLNIVGNGKLLKSFKSKEYNFNVTFHGFESSKTNLLRLYRANDILCVPSFTETFGLVYIEALSQSLPIIYTKHQGIDGFFESGEVGYSINPTSAIDISEKIILIIENYSLITKKSHNKLNRFTWGDISLNLVKEYRTIK